MDEADLAQRENDVHMAMMRRRMKTANGPGADYCEDCGRRIPDARRQAAPSCTRCVTCQNILEKGRHRDDRD